ncbi:MAG: hypothetical protein JRI25_24645 [Deltaproteobacteria bacterium]|nr:hypothetical protein [Deltaproteobacteria bacterium]
MLGLLLLSLAGAAEPTDGPSDALVVPGPFVMEDQAGNSLRLRFVGQVQANLDLRSDDDWAPVETLRFRRVRLLVDTDLLDGRLRTGFQLNTQPGALELMDLWGQVGLGRDITLKVGQFKVPWTRYRAQSFASLLLVDWPIATRFFGAERQLGLMASDGKPGEDRFGWAIGVFAGSNARASFATGVGSAHAELWANPSSLTGPSVSWAVHPELVGRVSTGTPGIDARTSSDIEGGSLRWLGAFSIAADLAPDPIRDFSLRLSPELLVKGGGLSANLVGYAGFFESDDTPLAPASLGGVVEVGWRLAPRWGVAASYSRVDQLPALRDTARARADAVIDAARPRERDALEAAYASAGVTGSEQEMGAGLDWWVAGDTVKLQLDGAWLRTQTTGFEDGLRLRLQAQVAL